ncbi:MAG: biopolymer transporter ExbB [Pseudomonadota bacterium]
MDRLTTDADAQFAQPIRQILLMIIVLVLTGVLAYLAYPQVAPVFLANPWLNGVIGLVFVIGVLACFWQLWQLVSSVIWIDGFVQERPGHQFTRAPRLLASLAALLRARGARATLGTSSARSILDSVATRIDEARDITRYIVNVLIFLGLLGTFYGLATTVPAVVDTIRSLAPAEGEELGGAGVFGQLLSGLESQLGGMGVAFASSLLGLAGSLVVGLLELFASHGQNRFYRELEDWLSTITRVGFTGGDVDVDGGGGGATAAVLDHMAQQIDSLTSLYEQSDASRAVVDERLGNLADAVDRMVTRIEGEGQAEATLQRLAAGQERLAEALQAQAGSGGGGEADAESRMRLRSMDVQLLRILEEMASGRQEMMDDLRSDIHNLTRAIEALGRGR